MVVPGPSEHRAEYSTPNAALTRRVLRLCRLRCRSAPRQHLSLHEVANICGLDPSACERALTTLVESGFVIRTSDGTFMLSDFGPVGDWAAEITSGPTRGDVVIMRRCDARYALSVFPNAPSTVYPSFAVAMERASLATTSTDTYVWFTTDRHTFVRSA